MRNIQELVYLSTSKLDHFIDKSNWWQKISLKVDTSLPLGLKFGMEVDRSSEDANETAHKLRRVRRALADSRKFQHFPMQQPTSVEPGAWIAFQARLNYRTIQSGPFAGAVIFVDLNESGSRFDGPAVRLLLHGSAKNLLDGREVPEFDGDLAAEVAGRYPSFSGWMDQLAHHMIQAGTLEGQPLFNAEDERPLESKHTSQVFAQGTQAIVAALDEELPPATAAWMGGLARITGAAAPAFWREADRDLGGSYWRMPPQVVVATPLYVEFSPPA